MTMVKNMAFSYLLVKDLLFETCTSFLPYIDTKFCENFQNQIFHQQIGKRQKYQIPASTCLKKFCSPHLNTPKILVPASNLPNPRPQLLNLNVGRGPYLSLGNCIHILWQKTNCSQILGHKWIHMDSDQITDSFDFEKNVLTVFRFGEIDISQLNGPEFTNLQPDPVINGYSKD